MRKSNSFGSTIQWLKSIVIPIVLLSPMQAAAQGADELLGAALRLKEAHVQRSYEQCIAGGKLDPECRSELIQLHPREISVLARLAELSGGVPEAEFASAFTDCYGPDRNYKQLIECWENTATQLASHSLSRAEEIEDHEFDLGAIERHLISQLSCIESPNAIFSFLALQRVGKISAAEMVGIDGFSCFRIYGGIEINGLRFDSICGQEDNGLVVDLYPEFLWRAPGCCPVQFLSLGTSASFESVARWYLNTFHRPNLLSQAIRSEYTTFGDRTELLCSDWIRN